MDREGLPQAPQEEVQLAALQQVSQAISGARSLEEVLETVVNAALLVYEGSSAWVMLETGGVLVSAVARGREDAVLRSLRCSPGQGVLGAAWRQGTPLVLFPEEVDEQLRPLLRKGEALVLIPFGVRRRGLLGCVAPAARLYNLRFLLVLAGQATLGLQRAQLAEQLQSRQEELALRARMAVDMAHELKNSLGSLSLLVELLARRVPEDEAAERIRERALREIGRLERLSRELLEFSRRLSPAPLDLHGLLRGVLEDLQDELERRGVTVEEDLWEGGSPLTIWADELMLRMAFLNVVRNALEAMEGVPERRLTVRTRCLEGAVMVEVQDRGPGVRPELREQVFEPHFTTKPSGSGLGLTMARKALESHGGTIVLESPPEGGTVVRMVLPIRPMLALQEPQP